MKQNYENSMKVKLFLRRDQIEKEVEKIRKTKRNHILNKREIRMRKRRKRKSEKKRSRKRMKKR